MQCSLAALMLVSQEESDPPFFWSDTGLLHRAAIKGLVQISHWIAMRTKKQTGH